MDKEQPLKGHNTLIVEDIPAAATISKNMLRSLGANDIHTATNYNQALKLVQENFYRTILCDFSLGKGPNGQQLLSDLKEQKFIDHNTLFIMVSGETSPEMVLGAVDCEPDGYISKPFQLKTLSNRIIHMLCQQHVMKPFHDAMRAGYIDEAVSLADQISATNQRFSAFAQRRKASELLNAGELDAALDTFRAINEKREQHWALLGKARCLMGKGDYEQARSDLLYISEKYPMVVAVLDALTECERALKNNEEAEKTLEKAISLSPNTADRQKRMEEIAEENGNTGRAIKAARTVMDLSEGTQKETEELHTEHLKKIRKCLQKEEDTKATNELLSEATQQTKKSKSRFPDSESVDYHRDVISALKQKAQGKTREAQKTLSNIIHRRSKLLDQDPDTAIDLAEVMIANNESGAALDLLNKTAQSSEKLTKEQMNQIQEMIRTPVQPHIREKISRLNRKGSDSYRKNNFESALDYFEQSLAEFPENLILNLNAAQTAIKLAEDGLPEKHHLRKARHFINKCPDVDQNHPENKRMMFITQYLEKQGL